MAEVQSAEGGGKKRHQKKHKKKRMAVRIDMTPMVDVAFLLLTFFMLTTVFNAPQTMEINLPPQEAKVEVAESNLLNLRVGADGGIYWSMGSEVPKKIAFNQVRPLVTERSKANDKLITLIRVDREGTYSMLVDIMDELNLANITRFSLAPFEQADKDLISKAL
jgi:biopolymer transport protein ExbD